MWPQYFVLGVIALRFCVSLVNLGRETDKNRAIGIFLAGLIWSTGTLYVLSAGGFFVNMGF